MTDYEKFVDEAERLGAKRVGKIGDFDGKFYDAWQADGQGFIVARNHVGRIGIYAFVGKDGAPAEDDIQWLTGKVLPFFFFWGEEGGDSYGMATD